MAFTNYGNLVFLAAGESTGYIYWFGGRADRGFQHAGADIKTPNNGAWVAVHHQRKQKLNDGSTTYGLTIQNLGPGAVWCNIQGGGAA